MADECDLAQAAETLFRQEALGSMAGNDQRGPSLTHCEECGDPIPETRRRAIPGCRLCVGCQEEVDGH